MTFFTWMIIYLHDLEWHAVLIDEKNILKSNYAYEKNKWKWTMSFLNKKKSFYLLMMK